MTLSETEININYFIHCSAALFIKLIRLSVQVFKDIVFISFGCKDMKE